MVGTGLPPHKAHREAVLSVPTEACDRDEAGITAGLRVLRSTYHIVLPWLFAFFHLSLDCEVFVERHQIGSSE